MIKAKKTNAQSAIVQQSVQALEKAFRKNKKPIFADLALRLRRPSRQRTRVNVWKLDRLASQLPGKTLVVPGYVLGFGTPKNALDVIALAYSESARKKIGSKAQTFLGAVNEKTDTRKWVIVA